MFPLQFPLVTTSLALPTVTVKDAAPEVKASPTASMVTNPALLPINVTTATPFVNFVVPVRPVTGTSASVRLVERHRAVVVRDGVAVHILQRRRGPTGCSRGDICGTATQNYLGGGPKGDAKGLDVRAKAVADRLNGDRADLISGQGHVGHAVRKGRGSRQPGHRSGAGRLAESNPTVVGVDRVVVRVLQGGGRVDVPVEIMLVVQPLRTTLLAAPEFMVSTCVPDDGAPPVTEAVMVSLPDVKSTR